MNKINEPYLYSLDKPINCQHTTALQAGNSIFHLHNHYELFYLEEGEISYFVEESCYSMKSGDLILFTGSEIHKARNLRTTPYTRMVVHFSPGFLQQFITVQTNLLACFRRHKSGLGNCITLSPEEQQQFMAYFKRMENTVLSNAYGDDLSTITALIDLLILVNQAFFHAPMAKKSATSPSISKIMQYIAENIAQPLSLESIVLYVALDKHYLCHLFKSETGSTIFQYISSKRIALAKSLLEDGFSVIDSCHAAGFNDLSHFIRTFRTMTGYTPLKYQKTIFR